MAVYIIVFVLLLPATHGYNCGLEHCMKCDLGRCTECQYGYYGNRCTIKCQGCWLSGCEQYSGRCIQCAPGYYTELCDTTCPHNCQVSYDGQRYCNRTTGHCLEGCEESYWGSQCTERCSPNCYKNICEQVDGKCLEVCNDGWFGLKCNKTCPHNCFHKRCSSLLGECSRGCKQGFQGRMCNVSCNICIDDECTYNELTELVNCTKGCKWTSYGRTSYNCNERCDTCLNKECDGNVSCIACPLGYYGKMCSHRCPVSCETCDKKSGRCIANGRNETKDETTMQSLSTQKNFRDLSSSDLDRRMSCQRCFRVSPLVLIYLIILIASYLSASEGVSDNECLPNCSACSQGNCTECNPAFWGENCKKECTDCWRGKCDKDNGRCIECTPGLYTENCNKTCPETCRPGNNNLTQCNRETGECMRCELGVGGKFCERNFTENEHITATTFELNVVAEGRRAAEQDLSNTVLGKLSFTLILVLIPFVVVAGVHVLPLFVDRIRRKVYSIKSKSDKREEETSVPLSVNYHKISQRNGE